MIGMAVNLRVFEDSSGNAQVIPRPLFKLLDVCLLVDETEEGPTPPIKVQIVGLELNPDYANLKGWWYSVSAVEGWPEPHLGRDFQDWVHECHLSLTNA